MHTREYHDTDSKFPLHHLQQTIKIAHSMQHGEVMTLKNMVKIVLVKKIIHGVGTGTRGGLT